MDTVTVVIQGGIALLVILVAVYGWPLAKQTTKMIKWDIVQKVIEKFVYAAEQYIKGQKKGNEKLAYAKDKIKDALKVFGITLDDEILTALIDGTVFEKLNKDKNVKA